MRNILDYGAVGDGVTLDTAAIQQAIDAGGMVCIPAGTWRIGTLYLKSNGGLHLEHGAVLIASHDLDDYNKGDFCPQNWISEKEYQKGEHLIVAVEQENITIEGHGTIDGQGRHWMNESRMMKGCPFPENLDYAPQLHPSQMVYFCECRNVHITDICLTNSPYWHLFFHGCEDVLVRGTVIRGDRPRWTNDGIDIDCCARVTVSDCTIDVGDDALTLRGCGSQLLHRDAVCEQITVTNCVLRSARDFGIRIGVGEGVIRNCVLSNLDIEAPNCAGIGFMGRWHPDAKNATSIERLLFSNINVRGRRGLEMVVAEGDAPMPNSCFLRNISFSHLLIEQDISSKFYGNDEVMLENIRFSDVFVNPTRGADDSSVQFAFRNAQQIFFYRMYVENCDGRNTITAENRCEIIMDGMKIWD